MSTNSHIFGPVYSSANSLGIIIATGNIGRYLEFDERGVNSYISVDGGHNWKEIAVYYIIRLLK
jgi:hypothetical protein